MDAYESLVTTMRNSILSGILVLALASPGSGQVTSETNKRLADALKQYPAADKNKDGILTMDEARAFLRKRGQQGAKGPRLDVHSPTEDEIRTVIEAGRKANGDGPLQFEKGDGVRVVMTGHSWVAPGRKTLPEIAEAAGFENHHQRWHMSGGPTGAANAIWLKEFGKWHKEEPPNPVLLPAIATGQWDVMTWGSYYEDQPEFYTQWIDLCLEYNPKMEFCIQDGWPRFDPSWKSQPREKILQAIDAQSAELQGYYLQHFDHFGKKYPGKVRVIPAGPAVVELIHRFLDGRVPHFDCIDERSQGGKRGVYRDGGHLSRDSGTEWLVGYLYYGMLYRKSPELIGDFTPDGVPERLDRTLREIAWQAITTSPMSGIVDKDRDGVGD
jgi:hypothetical protein